MNAPKQLSIYARENWSHRRASEALPRVTRVISAFVTAHYRVYGDAEQAYSYLEPFADQLNDAGLGTLDEIFEGDPPHTPSGAIAQAWSVAEVLRAYRVIRPDTPDSVKQAKQVTTAK